MKCPNCQAENPDSATFCNNCGVRLESPQAQAPPPAEKKKRGIGRTLLIAVGAAVVLCIVVAILASLGGGGDEGITPTATRLGEAQLTEPAPTEAQIAAPSPEASEPPTDTASPPTDTAPPPSTDTPSPTDTPVPTNTPLPPTATTNPDLLRPGTYIVGTDIQPGIYRGEAGQGLFSSCYWARLKDLSGSLDALIANDNSIGQFYVEVIGSDNAFQTDCEVELLRTMPQPPAEFPQQIAPGTYLVGIDIQPGQYRGQAGTDITDSCYWARLNDVRGGLNSIISNDNANGQYYVRVQPGDFALQTGCELERTGD
jgi:hypothetical protein